MIDHRPADRRAPPSWTTALERGRADIAAGRTQDAEDFLRRLEREDAELGEPEPRRVIANR